MAKRLCHIYCYVHTQKKVKFEHKDWTRSTFGRHHQNVLNHWLTLSTCTNLEQIAIIALQINEKFLKKSNQIKSHILNRSLLYLILVARNRSIFFLKCYISNHFSFDCRFMNRSSIYIKGSSFKIVRDQLNLVPIGCGVGGGV